MKKGNLFVSTVLSYSVYMYNIYLEIKKTFFTLLTKELNKPNI